MRIRKIAAITLLVFSSFAASNVAPSKSELEEMYNKAFRYFDANNYGEALKQLDEIDVRQPDVAESQNLRGVILMRQGIYDKAEAALLEAIRIDPKFWNARFNLAEIPFLKKDWAEARDRFQKLLSSNVSDLQGEAAQLIQYKVLLTYLLEGKENMVDSILAKFELSPDTPAVHYANAAIALERKNPKEARDWMAAAEKNFSPQLNKLFAESLYEVGWLEKPAGQARASLPLTTAAERVAKTKGFARSRFEQAQQAVQQRDFATALKFIDEADAAEPNQPATLNLRGEILMEQKQFDQAEAAFKKVSKLDPKFREAQYNLAQIPFKQKDYGKARDRFEALFNQTPGGDKNQAAQILKFKVYMTLLLEGKESRAQKMMEQFQFTGDTPALYYAQAAWEFKHNNPSKATDWIASAKKIYPSALNNLFSDAFYDLGWLQSPAIAAAPGAATEAAAAMSAQAESSPAIEPSPIPGTAVAAKKPSKETKTESVASSAPVAGMEATTSRPVEPTTVAQAPAAPSSASGVAGTPARPEEIPAPLAAPIRSPTVETSVTEAAPAASAVASAAALGQRAQPAPAQSQPSVASAPPVVAAASATPATVLAPARVREWSQPVAGGAANRLTDPQTLLVGGLLLAGIFLLAWVIVPEIRRRIVNMPMYRRATPVTSPRVDEVTFVSAEKRIAASPRLIGGPRQMSLKLKASEPSWQRSVLPATMPGRPFGTVTIPGNGGAEVAASRAATPEVELPPFIEPVLEPSVGPVVEQKEEVVWPTVPQIPEPTSWPIEAAAISEMTAEATPAMEAAFEPPIESVMEPQIEAVTEPQVESVLEPQIEPVIESQVESVIAPVTESEIEPIGQGQPVPYQTPLSVTEITRPEPDAGVSHLPVEVAAGAAIAGVGALRQIVETPSFVPKTVSTEPSLLQTTTPVTMPEPIQTPTAPVIRTPASGGAPQPAGAMQTAVQLTFSFEIASMQLTPTFKMGAISVRPTSKVVAMRLAPSQHPQPAMNLQVTFEISKIQPAGGAFGNIRLTPSQQQRPTPISSPSFAVAGLQLVSNFESAPVQLTPSQQGQASVLVTASFQIATVEFSPSFEIASIVLNSHSKQVSVQLPGAGPSSVEGAPVFEIANLQLGGGGEIALMQLNLLGHGPKRA
jgi:tetratricopeptide (TPR) repeat protein